MKSKKEIVDNWLPLYTGMQLNDFGQYILLTCFREYVFLFAEMCHSVVKEGNNNMLSATNDNITIIFFTAGSPMAATIMDLLSAVQPKAVLFLGKCGSLKPYIDIGEFVLPIAAIRGEGTSNDYFPPEVPSLPAFNLEKAISTTVRDYRCDYWTGIVYTTNKRVWEHDSDFQQYLKNNRVTCIDMETATLFSVGFANRIPTGALLIVSDKPYSEEGLETSETDKLLSEKFALRHLKIGFDALHQLIDKGLTVKYLKFDYYE